MEIILIIRNYDIRNCDIYISEIWLEYAVTDYLKK